MIKQSRILVLGVVLLFVLIVVHFYHDSLYKSILGMQVKKMDVQVKKSPEIIPVVTDQLTISPFSKNWTEDPVLTHLRQFGAVENIPGVDVINKYDLKKTSAIYHSYLDNEHVRCHRKLRMGNVGDGGWEICDDIEWRPVPPCVIYSFGINYDFTFDDDAGKIYGCDVYSFDPSMAKMNTMRRSARVMFYKVGIGGKSGQAEKMKNGWTLHSFANIRVMLNHSKTPIDVLKMDVEGSEWPALTTMLKEGQLSDVRQLLIEYHAGGDNAAQLRNHLQILRDLEREGFKIFYASKNFHCARKAVGMPITRTSCYEVHYLNTNFRK